MTNQSDDELVQSAQSGDKTAFEELVRRYERMVLRIAKRQITQADLTHDLVQETFLRAYLSLDQLRSTSRFRSWLYGIALNVCREYHRQQRTNVYSLDALAGGIYRDPTAYGPTPEELVERLELRQVVKRALDQLSAKNRIAVVLYYYEGFSQREIADMLTISESAVKGRLYKARRSLEGQLLQDVRSRQLVQGERLMIPVKLVDVTQQYVEGDEGEDLVRSQIILWDERSRRALVIWVGESEAFATALGIAHYTTPRPLTAEFMARLLDAAYATVEAVEISTLRDNVFIATVRIKVGESVQEVDARPSDALALAVRVDAPVFVAQEVMDKMGVALPAAHMPTGKGVQTMVDRVNTKVQAWAEASTQSAEMSNWEASARMILDEVFE